MESTSKDDEAEKDKNKTDKNETTAEGNTNKNADDKNPCSTAGSDLDKNPKEAFSQFNIKPENAESKPETVNRRMSAEEVSKSYERLGLKRCQFCKFTTDDEVIFKNHADMCLSKSLGGKRPEEKAPIDLKYDGSIFHCLNCSLHYSSKQEFEEHIVCHTTDNPYICLTCKQSFVSRKIIEQHTKTVHVAGNAKCGLRGIKRGRQIVDDLLKDGSKVIYGKLAIPKTIDNKSEKQSPCVPVQIQPKLLKPAVSSAPPTYMENYIIVKTSQENTTTCKIPASATVNSSAGAVTTTVASTRVYVPKKVDKEKEEAINSLFGIINPETKEIMATNVSTKIQKIVNPVTSTRSLLQPTSSQYKVQDITEYTSTPAVRLTSTTISTVAPSNGQFLLVPIGPSLVQTSAGPSALNTSTSIRPQMIVIGGQVPPSASAAAPPSVTSGRSLISGIPATTMSSFSKTNQPIMMQFIQSKPPTPIKLAKSFLPTVDLPLLQTTISPSLTQINPANATVVIATGSTSTTEQNQPITVPASKRHSVIIVPNSESQVNTSINPSLNMPGPRTDLEKFNVKPRLAPQPSTKKLLFRIKPGQGYVCEACKKFTKDELIFRKHLWEHFHGIPLACSSCTFQQLQSKDILNCKLVGNIVCSLVKRSTEDKRRSKPFKIVKNGEKEIIDITDDDTIKELTADLEQESNGNNGSTAEVIVLDDDDGDSGCLQIKICETYSLADQKILNIDKTLSDESNHAGSCVEKTDEDISSSKPKDESLRSKEKDLTKGSDKSEDVDDVDENRQTNTLSELQKIDENPNEEDAAPTNDLLNKSLSQSEAETECTVAKVIDSNLKLDDPKLLEKDKEIDFLIDQALLPVEPETNKESSLVGLKSSRISQSNKAVEEFDKQTLEQLGYNSFYACGYEPCGFTCLSSVKYREHLKDKKHQTEYCYLCSHCGQKDYKEDSHVRHLFSHSMSKTFLLYKCPLRLCKFKTNMIQFYEEHLKAHPKEELNIKCTYCHQMFPSIESLSQHLQKNLLKFITCPYCSFKFEKKLVVFQHIKHSHPDKIRMISVSGQIVCNEREINFYVVPKAKTNPDQERVNPKVIDRMLIDNSSANSLDIPRLLEEVQGERVDEIENNVDTNNCGSEIDDSEDAENESLPDLDQTQTESDTPNKKGIERLSDGAKNEPKQVHDSIGPKCLLCPKCKYLSYNQSYHIQHMSLHDKEPEREKRFLCYLCPKGLESLPNLKKHIQNHLGKHDINVYCCTVCSYMSNQKAHIMDHCEDGHEQKSMYTLKEETVESTNYYTCKYCDFVTRAVDQVSQHENVVHKVKPIVSMEPMQKVTETFKASFKEETMKEQKQSKKESEGGKKKYHCEYCSTFWKHKADLKKHMLLEHDDIENKQFTSYKCKYCNLTSTMKDLIVKHYDKMHTGLAIRILRKVEHIDIPSNEQNSVGISKQPDHEEDSEKSVETIDVVIPDGTIFKTPFKCQNCDFMSNYRITTMRHLKEHPNMRPVRPNPCKKTPSKPTARKSTTIPNPFSSGKKTPHKNSLLQNGPNAGRFLLNPFAKVKEAVAETRGDPSSPSKDFYVLGENRLHSALTACFTAMVEDLRFQCRICTQKIAKKFVLHRHILDHLKIVFFKCRYCNEGTIERTLIAGHIQKEHSNMPLVYDTVSKQELEDLLEERTCNLDFNDKIDIQVDVKKGSTVPRDLGLKTEQVHEIADVKSDVENEITKEKPNSMTFVAASNSRKCPMCRYVAKKDNVLVSHIAAHDDPYKKFVCSGCDYRGDKYNVIKHIYRVVHSVPARIVEQQSGKKTTTNQRDDKSAEDTNSKKVLALPKPEKTPKKKADTASIHSEDSDCISNSKGKSVSIDSFTVSLHGVFEIKTKVKCKICGEKKESKSSMYGHFRSSPKCNGPYYQCSLCSFQSSTKIAIRKHAQIRHPKTKAIALTLPMAAKMKVIKIPIKQDNQVANMLKKRKAAETDLDSDFYNVDVDVDDSDDTKTEDSCNQIKSSSSEIACRLCQTYTCANVMKLQYHVNTFHQGTTVHCQKCSYKTPVLQHIFNHCKNVHHQNVPQYSDKKMELENIKRNDSDLPVTSPKVGTGKHECPKCNKRFVNAGSLKPHLFKHFNYSPYKCKLCKASFFRSDYIQKHFEAEHHGKEFIKQYVRNDAIEEKVNKIMKINRRPKNFDKFKVVEEGIRFHNGVWYCNECGKSSDFLKGIKSHLQIHSNTSRKRPFESERDVVQLKGKKTKLVNDPQILQEASSSDDAKDSSKSLIKFKIEVNGNGNKMYRCGYCNLSFNNKFKVKNHIAGVHQKMNKFKYKCCFCGYLSMFSGNVYRHVGTHHNGKPKTAFSIVKQKVISPENRESDISTDSERHFEVDTHGELENLGTGGCDDDTNSTSEHLFEFSTMRTPTKRRRTITYRCPICFVEEQSVYYLRIHLAQHEEFRKKSQTLDRDAQLSCGYCSYVGRNLLDLETHSGSHVSECKYRCLYCPYYAFKKHMVIMHCSTVHQRERPNVFDKLKKIDLDGNDPFLVKLQPNICLTRVRISASVKSRYFKRIKLQESDSEEEALIEENTKLEQNLIYTDSNRKEDSINDVQKCDNEKTEELESDTNGEQILNQMEINATEGRNDDIQNQNKIHNEVLAKEPCTSEECLVSGNAGSEESGDRINVYNSEESKDSTLDQREHNSQTEHNAGSNTNTLNQNIDNKNIGTKSGSSNNNEASEQFATSANSTGEAVCDDITTAENVTDMLSAETDSVGSFGFAVNDADENIKPSGSCNTQQQHENHLDLEGINKTNDSFEDDYLTDVVEKQNDVCENDIHRTDSCKDRVAKQDDVSENDSSHNDSCSDMIAEKGGVSENNTLDTDKNNDSDKNACYGRTQYSYDDEEKNKMKATTSAHENQSDANDFLEKKSEQIENDIEHENIDIPNEEDETEVDKNEVDNGLKDNIFEKYDVSLADKASNKNDVNETNTADENIFERFGFNTTGNSEPDNEENKSDSSQNEEEDNIIEKANREHPNENTDKKLSDMLSAERMEESESDKNLFELFRPIDSEKTETVNESVSESETRNENLVRDVERLLEDIDQTIQDAKKAGKSPSLNSVVDMETD